jgi:hypothetical protein
VRERKSELARLETLDMGKPIAESEWDMDDVAGCFEYYAGLAEALDGRQGEGVDLGSDDFACRLRREPLGVVALITPWNYPREAPPPCPPADRPTGCLAGPLAPRGRHYGRRRRDTPALGPPWLCCALLQRLIPIRRCPLHTHTPQC